MPHDLITEKAYSCRPIRFHRDAALRREVMLQPAAFETRIRDD